MNITEEQIREIIRDEVGKIQRDIVRAEIKAIGEEARRDINERLSRGEKVFITP